jgi:anti-sigma regulatory factor (Ser/Thr protein kinase)
VSPGRPFRHEALFYANEQEFVAGTLPFIREGVAMGEHVMVAVSEAKARMLGSALNGDGGQVTFVDMARLGRNPARIIPAWQEFVRQHVSQGTPGRGIGEPIWPGRSPDELVECEHHESLLNLAFGDGPAWRLRCPYDSARLDAGVLDAARRNHPLVAEGGVCRHSPVYVEPQRRAGPFAGHLSAASREAAELTFTRHDLATVRDFVAEQATRAGLDETRTADLMLAVNELATNSMRHAGGTGVVRAWVDDGALVCEVRDDGRITYPLTGRVRPPHDQPGGRGLWLVNHLCDLVQIRSLPTENIVRVRIRRQPA